MAGTEQDYPDYQRVENWDGPTLLTNRLVENANVTLTVGDVSRYASLKITMSPGKEAGKEATQTKVECEWLSNDAVRVPLGKTTFTLGTVGDRPSDETMKLRLPNQGPFCQLKMATLMAGGKMFWNLWAGADNRQIVMPHTLGFPYVFNMEKHKDASKTSAANPFTCYFAGPVVVAVFVTKAPYIIALELRDPTTGEWLIYDAQTVTEANKWVRWDAVAVMGACRIHRFNESTEEAEATIHITPSPTGAV